LLGGGFQVDDVSWPAITAHALAVHRGLAEWQVHRARAEASSAHGDAVTSITAAAIDRHPGTREAA
jgi:hypothetical protein